MNDFNNEQKSVDVPEVSEAQNDGSQNVNQTTGENNGQYNPYLQYGQNPYNQNPYYQNPPYPNQQGYYGQYQQNPYGYYPQNNSYNPYNGQSWGGYNYPPQGYGYPQNFVSPEEMQKRQERKKIMSKLGNGIGIPLCLFSIISYIISRIFVFVVTLALGQSSAAEVFSDPNVNYLLSAFISVISLTIPFLITSKLTGVKWKETLHFQKVGATKFLSVIMFGLGICALSNYASGLVSALVQGLTGKGSQTTMIEFGTDWQSFCISMLCVGILPALFEEFAFRGIVLGSLRKYMNDSTAIFVSAALFALLHGNLQQIPFAFGVGLALGYATVYCKSIVPALVLHGINNSFSVIITFATRIMSPMNSQITTMFYLAALLLIGVCGFIMLVLTDKEAFSLSKANSDSSARDVKQFCSAAAIIVFFVFSGLSVLITQFM